MGGNPRYRGENIMRLNLDHPARHEEETSLFHQKMLFSNYFSGQLQACVERAILSVFCWFRSILAALENRKSRLSGSV
jgi:hypothetical protein